MWCCAGRTYGIKLGSTSIDTQTCLQRPLFWWLCCCLKSHPETTVPLLTLSKQIRAPLTLILPGKQVRPLGCFNLKPQCSQVPFMFCLSCTCKACMPASYVTIAAGKRYLLSPGMMQQLAERQATTSETSAEQSMLAASPPLHSLVVAHTAVL